MSECIKIEQKWDPKGKALEALMDYIYEVKTPFLKTRDPEELKAAVRHGKAIVATDMNTNKLVGIAVTYHKGDIRNLRKESRNREIGSVRVTKNSYRLQFYLMSILAMMEFLLDRPDEHIIAVTDIENIASQKNIMRSGFNVVDRDENPLIYNKFDISENKLAFTFDETRACEVAAELLGFRKAGRIDNPNLGPLAVEFDVKILDNGAMEKFIKSCECDAHQHRTVA